jgi:hypothetical protein
MNGGRYLLLYIPELNTLAYVVAEEWVAALIGLSESRL